MRFAACCALLVCNAFAQPRTWTAQWIDVAGAPKQDYGVYHFRRTFDLSSKPEHFTVYVSGDNRYQLFVNGKLVSWGPARGELTHWRYETVDIAAQLRAGKNALAAVVWNDGQYRALAQVTNQTGFMLDSDSAEVNTNSSWKCIQDRAYSPQPLPRDQSTGYYALAANERFDAQAYPWGWEQIDFDDSSWLPAEVLSRASSRYIRDGPNSWMLVPRAIPLEEQTLQRMAAVRRTEGAAASDEWLRDHGTVQVPAHARASLLLDQSFLTTAYPELTLSGGKRASIDLKYAEAPYSNRNPVQKGNRNDIEGKQFYGPSDTYLADGGSHRVYRPLYWRTFRYIQLTVQTADDPLVLEDIRNTFTGYPFEKRASFRVDDSARNEEVQRILTTGWHTARLCAHETYMDCPYYEQLQYGGDARIQMMVSLYMTGDARLMKNGIEQLNSSRTAEGATYSRAPSSLPQYIPPFSLWWIGMVHDYWMYVDDPQFVKEMLPGVRAVLDFYARYERTNGTLARMPWWNFVDWVKQWPAGEPLADPDGSAAAALDLQHLLAYQWAGDLELAVGRRSLADEDFSAAVSLKQTILASDWDSARGLFADQPSHRTYSQQVNTLAVLAHLVPEAEARPVLEKTLTDGSLAQSSIYFRAYTNAALREAGLGDRYLDELGPWRQMLEQGLTTWAEWNAPDTRSDCHAWGASPNFELLRTVAGIESTAPAFAQVRIAPHFGTLMTIKASMPHPKGEIAVDLKRTEGKLSGQVVLPTGIVGEFVWQDKRHPLTPGRNRVNY